MDGCRDVGADRMLVTAVGVSSAVGMIISLVTGAGDKEKDWQKAIEAAMKATWELVACGWSRLSTGDDSRGGDNRGQRS